MNNLKNSHSRRSAIAVSAILLLLAGCKESPVRPPPEDPLPEILVVQVRDNPNNVLSAMVSVRTSNAVVASVEMIDDSLSELEIPFFAGLRTTPVLSPSSACLPR